eukprot:10474246-Alexandrium_andersonii.AAC.1
MSASLVGSEMCIRDSSEPALATGPGSETRYGSPVSRTWLRKTLRHCVRWSAGLPPTSRHRGLPPLRFAE